MRHEAEALAAIKDAIHLAVQYLFDAEVKISKALVAQSKADALRKREGRMVRLTNTKER